MPLKGVRLRIYPTQLQIQRIESNFGAVRKVWNLMLAMQKDRKKNNPNCRFVSKYDINLFDSKA